MNKNHHKKIQDIIDKLEDLYTEIDKIQDEEKKSHDNSLSHLQDGEKSERMPDIIYNLDHAYCSLGDAISYLDDAIQSLSNKIEKKELIWD